jgi:hypothetical protein
MLLDGDVVALDAYIARGLGHGLVRPYFEQFGLAQTPSVVAE